MVSRLLFQLDNTGIQCICIMYVDRIEAYIYEFACGRKMYTTIHMLLAKKYRVYTNFLSNSISAIDYNADMKDTVSLFTVHLRYFMNT